jgi:hypothetical protein
VRLPILAIFGALLGLLVSMPAAVVPLHAREGRGRSDVMPLSAIRPKMKGYGLTVFEGTRPERFDVEVIDVLRRFLPRQDLILIRTHHPRLDVAKVVAGMSGSPIFIDGKMIGAYSYGWQFAAEPVAGVTPIENMLSELDRPLPKEIYGWPLGASIASKSSRPSSSARAAASETGEAHRYEGPAEKYSLLDHGAQIAARMALHGDAAAVRPVSTPLLLGGTTPGATQLAERLLGPLGFEPLQAGGGGLVEADAPTQYEDGGAIGVQLISGDISATGLGTVTRVEGDRLVAFGHPMMQAGATALPTAVSRVLWFLASQMRSFKMGMPVRPLGALVADRQSSIVVSQSARAPVIPVELRIEGVEGSPSNLWRFEIAHEKFLTPTFLAMAVGSAVQSVTAEKRDISWTADSVVEMKSLGSLTLEDFGIAVGGMPGPDEMAGWNVVEAVGSVLNNPWQPALVERISVVLRIRYARDVYRLRGAEVLSSEIDAGQPARIRLTLLPYAGPPVTRVLSIDVPPSLAGETVGLEIVPGYTESRERPAAENLSELVRNLDEPVMTPKSVVVRLTTRAPTVAYHGRVARGLPPGVAESLVPTSTTVTPQVFSGVSRQEFSLPFFMVGRERVSVQVRTPLR